MVDRVCGVGGLAVAASTADEWRSSEQGRAVAASPLGTSERLGSGAPPLAETAGLPASGTRVLDLTRMLGALGAEVLRIDDPGRPELPLHAIDGVLAKASATLDLATSAGNDVLHTLLDRADLLVTGYRPGALSRFGLAPDQIADRHPGTAVVTLSAWGTSGPWGERRGMDSLVQIASGIGWATSPDGARPGALPCQLLDHATGYLVAAAALAALSQRERTGETTHTSLSLACSAQWLLDQGRRDGADAGDGDVGDDAAAYRVPLGDGWSGIGPPGSIDGTPLAWPHLPPCHGRSQPEWR